MFNKQHLWLCQKQNCWKLEALKGRPYISAHKYQNNWYICHSSNPHFQFLPQRNMSSAFAHICAPTFLSQPHVGRDLHWTACTVTHSSGNHQALGPRWTAYAWHIHSSVWLSCCWWHFGRHRAFLSSWTIWHTAITQHCSTWTKQTLSPNFFSTGREQIIYCSCTSILTLLLMRQACYRPSHTCSWMRLTMQNWMLLQY